MPEKSKVTGTKKPPISITHRAREINKLEKKPKRVEISQKEAVESAESDSQFIHSEMKALFIGPLPPPEHVREYENILSGSFDRILILTEKNARHRMELDKHEMEMERQLVPESIRLKKSGQNKAFLISILGIISVVVLALLGQTTVASILAGTTLISLAPSFISGINKSRKTKDKE